MHAFTVALNEIVRALTGPEKERKGQGGIEGIGYCASMGNYVEWGSISNSSSIIILKVECRWYMNWNVRVLMEVLIQKLHQYNAHVISKNPHIRHLHLLFRRVVELVAF